MRMGGQGWHGVWARGGDGKAGGGWQTGLGGPAGECHGLARLSAPATPHLKRMPRWMTQISPGATCIRPNSVVMNRPPWERRSGEGGTQEEGWGEGQQGARAGSGQPGHACHPITQGPSPSTPGGCPPSKDAGP